MATGATISLETLISLRYQAGGIQLAHRSKALSQLSGQATANFRGRGLDFEEVRHYQPGDEPRAIDWRVTARTGQTHTKLFNEERERPTLLVVDQSSSMRFGTRQCFKSVKAAEIAALLGWASLQNHDRVGGLIINDYEHAEIRPRNSRKTLLNFFKVLSEYNSALLHNQLRSPGNPAPKNRERLKTASRFQTIANELRRIARPGTAIFILSDFRGIDEKAIGGLLQVARHTDITAIQINDPMEAELPAAQKTWFTNGSERIKFDLRNQKLRTAFRQDFHKFQLRLKEQFTAAGISLITASTLENAQQLLEYYYNPRSKRFTSEALKSVL